MIDFVLGLFLAGLLLRGWLRGLVREVLDLVGLIVGLWIAIRLSAPFGDFLTRSFGVTPEVARIGAGVALFLLFGISLTVAAHYLSKVMRLPGLNLINRFGGAAVAVAWGVALLVLVVNLADVLPLPAGFDAEMEDSAVLDAIVGPGALPQEIFDSLAGDNVLAALASIQDVFGANRAVPEGDEELSFPAAEPDQIRQVRREADSVLEEINEYRAGLGLRAVRRSEAMVEAAESRASTMYTTGTLARHPDCLTLLESYGAQVVECGEALAMAGSALGAFDGVIESETGRAELADGGYDRVGVAVVDGPTGRLLVIYLAR